MPKGRAPGPLGPTDWSGTVSRSAGPLTEGGEGRTLDEFREAVLQGQIRRSQARGKKYVGAVPDSELQTVEGAHRMRTEAAQACRKLLEAARAALAALQAENEPAALRVARIGVASAYRDYAVDERAWKNSFSKHYAKTQAKRESLPGGAHGDAACAWFVEYLAPIKAPPGFSNHSDGKAVDFSTEDGGTHYGPNTDQRKGWRGTWFHQWLVANAEQYRFHPLASEEWHWDYR